MTALGTFGKSRISENHRTGLKLIWLFSAIAMWMLCFAARPAQAQQQIHIILTQPLTDTGINLTEGQNLKIIAGGVMNWFTGSCNDCYTTPEGTSCPYTGFYAQGLPCWSLIGQIGDGKPFAVGNSYEITGAPAGELYLGVNDNNYPDNTGSWIAVINPVGKQQGDCGCNAADPGMAGGNPQDVGSPDDGSGAGSVDPLGTGSGGGGNAGRPGFRLLKSPASNGARHRAVFSRLPFYSINRASGNLFYTVTDYATAGQYPLAFVRYYNGRANLAGSPTLAERSGAPTTTDIYRFPGQR